MNKQVRRSRDPLPLNRVGGVALEAFNEAVRCWPLEVSGWNSLLQRHEVKKVGLGNTAIAQRNFLELIEGGHATAQELYACAWVASNKWKEQGYIWVPHLATFYGPEKELWATYLDEAREMLAKANQNEIATN